ncbi:hypothetical protein RIR_jg16083.t1 [Rhizophagus irregularis DAOM 181602=DAOM 197198]|uniref:Uncharacterized protein n=1 Tax=Rhizophagus irregularis (strain DAOM 181602 / DAOM 197198 / MUCL 43194) TaxID=747089 RepID=U9ULG7_RHIID|nr:hypothetical protein RIR_jg16083.t1 [Rhizophagus irregularis DAOM 181602=DAOM 197198]
MKLDFNSNSTQEPWLWTHYHLVMITDVNLHLKAYHPNYKRPTNQRGVFGDDLSNLVNQRFFQIFTTGLIDFWQ